MIITEKYSAIDLGTNTFHQIIFKDTGDAPLVLSKKRIPVGIGRDGIEKNIITKESLERGIQALLEFREELKKHRVKKVSITATSAFRSAKNKVSILKTIKERTGFDVQIIDGNEEAQLIFEGVNRAVNLSSETSLIMDIGGGSVEFIICDNKTILWKQSFEIGGLRLMERFHTEDPISEDNKEQLGNFLKKELEPLFEASKKHKPVYLIGASGSFDTICEIREAKNNNNYLEETYHSLISDTIDLDVFNKISKEIVSKSYSERLDFKGLISMRAEMIVVACLLIESVIDLTSISALKYSSYALKEGLMYRMIDEKKVL